MQSRPGPGLNFRSTQPIFTLRYLEDRVKRVFKKGEYIFREGDHGDCAYLIEKGRVEVFKQDVAGMTFLTHLAVGDIFGELAIIDSAPRNASVRAIEDTELSLVTRDQLSERIETLDPVVRLLITALTRRVRGNSSSMGNDLNLASKDSKFSDALHRINFEIDIKEALHKEEFYMVYQPIVQLHSRAIIGFEALIRWKNPKRGFVPPDQFIDIAENSALILPIGEWVLKRSITDFLKMREELNLPEAFISINVSGKQFTHPKFVEYLSKIENELQFDPKMVKLEATERIFMDGPLVANTMKRCRERGYKISLDDFGTGYSSLNSIAQLDLDVIKIDRGFLSEIESDVKQQAIVSAIVNMARGLNLEIVVEGIETESLAKRMELMGCQIGQGYLFGKPMSLEETIQKYSGKRQVG